MKKILTYLVIGMIILSMHGNVLFAVDLAENVQEEIISQENTDPYESFIVEEKDTASLEKTILDEREPQEETSVDEIQQEEENPEIAGEPTQTEESTGSQESQISEETLNWTWKTESGKESCMSIKSKEKRTVTVLWGEGEAETKDLSTVMTKVCHSYESEGEKEVTLKGTEILTHVDLSKQNVTSFAGGKATQLEVLYLQENVIINFKNTTFVPFQKLFYLDLSKNQLKGLEEGTLSSLSHLSQIGIYGNCITEDQIAESEKIFLESKSSNWQSNQVVCEGQNALLLGETTNATEEGVELMDIDYTQPSCGTWELSPDGPTSGNVVATLSNSTDDESGIKISGGSCTITDEGGNCDVMIEDMDGNQTICTSPNADNIDRRAPSCSIGWDFVGDETIYFDGSSFWASPRALVAASLFCDEDFIVLNNDGKDYYQWNFSYSEWEAEFDVSDLAGNTTTIYDYSPYIMDSGFPVCGDVWTSVPSGVTPEGVTWSLSGSYDTDGSGTTGYLTVGLKAGNYQCDSEPGSTCIVEVSDNVGNTTYCDSPMTMIPDTTPPSCGTWELSPDGPTSGNVVATLSDSTDDESGIKISGGSCTITNEGSTCGIVIEDMEGNKTTCTSPNADNIDRQAPYCWIGGWRHSEIYNIWAPAWAMVTAWVECDEDFIVLNNDGNIAYQWDWTDSDWYADFDISDLAGNRVRIAEISPYIADGAGPECGDVWTYSLPATGTITWTLSGSYDVGSQSNIDPFVSGLKPGSYQCNVTAPDNSCTVEISDNVGNTTYCNSPMTSDIDLTPPVCHINRDAPLDFYNGWYASSALLTAWVECDEDFIVLNNGGNYVEEGQGTREASFEIEDLAGNKVTLNGRNPWSEDNRSPRCGNDRTYIPSGLTSGGVIWTLSGSYDDESGLNTGAYGDSCTTDGPGETCEVRIEDNVLQDTQCQSPVTPLLDTTPPVCNVIYSTTGATSGNVLATLTGCSEPITITNNGGSTGYTFTGNGTFIFNYEDAAGNTGTTIANVTWIQEFRPFITTWDTRNITTGSSSDNQIKIPTNGAGYDFDVDWGDGTTGHYTGTTPNATHTYMIPGIYQVKIKGKFPRIYFNNGGEKSKLLNVNQRGDISWSTMGKSFYGCNNLRIPATDAPDLSRVTNMDWMFQEATSFNDPINHWNVSNITSMKLTFYGASTFNQSLNNWDTSNVRSMHRMFHDAYVFNQPLDNWDVSNVTDMGGMFWSAKKFNQPLNSWDVSNVGSWGGSSFNHMFADAVSFNQPLDNWDTSNATTFHSAFEGAISFDQNLSSRKIGSVTNASPMNFMFEGVRLSTYNYNAILDSRSKQMPQAGFTFHGGYSTYGGCNVSNRIGGISGHAELETTYGWTIIDGGLEDCKPVTPPSGGGAGGKVLIPDSCPKGDNSPSYYDGSCGKGQKTHDAPEDEDPTEKEMSDSSNEKNQEKSEYEKAFDRAYENALTSMSTLERARMEDGITRAEAAKLISLFSEKMLKKEPDTSKTACSSFSDMNETNEELQGYIKTSCQLGIMGYYANGKDIKPAFDPNMVLTRAEFGTILSRLLRGNQYAGTETSWYQSHLEALKEKEIMTKIQSPFQNEIRGNVLVMLRRITNSE